jgi:hypothetical protein
MRNLIFASIGLVLVALLAANSYQNYRRFHRPLLTTQYQAVTLQDGRVFYGRIDHLGSDYPVLWGAFTLRKKSGADNQEPQYSLVRRQDEINGADHMIFPATAIAYVEPVKPDSIVGRLLALSGAPRY